MRVLFLTNIPSPYRVNFFNELGKYCDLTVLFERNQASDRDTRWISEDAKNYKHVYLKGKNIGSDSSLCLEVIKWIDKRKFDVFVVGGYSTLTGMIAIQTMKMKKIPFILNSDGGIKKNDKKFIYLIKKYFISSASGWLSTGKITNDYLKYYGANEENIFIYPFTSILQKDILEKSLSIDEKNKLRKELGINNYKNISISVGQFIYRKGYDILIKIWKNIDRNNLLLIIGSGEKKDELTELIDKNNLENIKLIDFKEKEELKKYYLCSDLFILPTREDIWGLVINEAMACGLPVITTNKCIAGVELIENSKNGFIVNLDNKNDLEYRIKEVLDNNDLIQMISSHNLCKIKNYSIEKMAKEHIKIFKKFIEDKI